MKIRMTKKRWLLLLGAGMILAVGQVVNPIKIWFNVVLFGADPTGTNSSQTAFTVAEAAAKLVGGNVYAPAGTYLVGSLPIDTGVCYTGDGIGATTLFQIANTNADVIYGTQAGYSGGVITNPWSTPFGGGTQAATTNACVMNLNIDGNQANQSGNGPYYGVEVYAMGFLMQNVTVQDVKGDCIRTDYNYSGTRTPNRFVNVTANNCGQTPGSVVASGITSVGAVGFRISGTDSQMTNTMSFHNAAENYDFGPNSGGAQVTNSHGWGSLINTTYPVPCAIIEANSPLMNLECEGAANSNYGGVPQILILNNNVQGAVDVFSPTASAAGETPVGVRLGLVSTAYGGYGIIGSNFANTQQSTNAAVQAPTSSSSATVTSNRDNLDIMATGLSGGVVWSDGSTSENGNTINAVLDNSAATTVTISSGVSCSSSSTTVTLPSGLTAPPYTTLSGTGIPSNTIVSSASGNSLTISNTTSASCSGSYTLGTVYFQGSGTTFASTDTFHVHGSGPSCPAGGSTGISPVIANCGGDSNPKFVNASLSNPNGGIVQVANAVAMTCTTQGALASTGATISIFLSSTGQRYGCLYTTGASGGSTGVILQKGNTDGEQLVIVNNNTTGSITFAASGTSNVAEGTNIVIAEQGTAGDWVTCTYFNSSSLWYCK